MNHVLEHAAGMTGRYRNIDTATQEAAKNIQNELMQNPTMSGRVIHVDLKNDYIDTKPW